MALLDDIRKSEYLSLLGDKLQGLLDVPTTASRFLVNPTAFIDATTGKTAMPMQKGFAEGATGLPQRENLTVLDPNNRAYMEGYSQGEPFSYAAMALPFASAGANKLSDKLVQTITKNPSATAMNVIDYASMPFGNAIQSKYVPNVKAGEEMLVTHNLSQDKLYGVDRLGGLPVPSLAISKTGNPLEGFGDITLIGNKSLAQPSRNNPIFAADAYTVTKPNIYTKLDKAGEEYVFKKYLEPFGKFADEMTSEINQINKNFVKNMEFSTVSKARYLYEKGLLPDPNSFEKGSDFRRAVRQTYDDLSYNNPNFSKEYWDWDAMVADDVVNAGGNIDYKIFKGYTNTGRERYAPADIENIVKEMSGKTQGKEGNIPTAGALRGAITPRLKTEKDVLKARDKIVSKEEFENVKENLNNEYSAITDDLYDYLKKKNSGVDVQTFLQEIALGTANKYEYSANLYKEMPDSLKNRISSYAGDLKKMPTEYFEAKPQRALSLSEFEGALVPSDISQRALDILEKGGVKDILKYATPEEKIGLLGRFGKQMFGIAPVGLGYGLLGSDTEQ